MQMCMPSAGNAEGNVHDGCSPYPYGVYGYWGRPTLDKPVIPSVLIRNIQSALGYKGWPGLAWSFNQFRGTHQISLKKVLSFPILVLSTFERLIKWLMCFLHRNYWKGNNSKSDLGWRFPPTQFYSSEYAKEHYIFAGSHTGKEFHAIARKCHPWTQVSP